MSTRAGHPRPPTRTPHLSGPVSCEESGPLPVGPLGGPTIQCPGPPQPGASTSWTAVTPSPLAVVSLPERSDQVAWPPLPTRPIQDVTGEILPSPEAATPHWGRRKGRPACSLSQRGIVGSMSPGTGYRRPERRLRAPSYPPWRPIRKEAPGLLTSPAPAPGAMLLRPCPSSLLRRPLLSPPSPHQEPVCSCARPRPMGGSCMCLLEACHPPPRQLQAHSADGGHTF